MTVPMASILPQYTPDELVKCRSHRAIPIALRPPVFMKLADALHHRARARPAEVSELLITPTTSIQSGGY